MIVTRLTDRPPKPSPHGSGRPARAQSEPGTARHGAGAPGLEIRRHARVRKNVSGTGARPRLVVFRSARHIEAQVIDDTAGKTLASASTMESDVRTLDGDKTAAAKRVG